MKLNDAIELAHIAQQLYDLGAPKLAMKYAQTARNTFDDFDVPDNELWQTIEEFSGDKMQEQTIDAAMRLSGVIADSIHDLAQIIGLEVGGLTPETSYDDQRLMQIKSTCSQIIQAVNILGPKATN